MRVGGDSMEGAGINTGDILVVDKSELAEPGKLVVVALNGRFTLRRLIKRQDQFQLVAENPKYKPIVIPVYSSFEAWGVVVGLVRKL